MYTYPSFPVRERGLKLRDECGFTDPKSVVPRAGTWIETAMFPRLPRQNDVVPRAGTWIETVESFAKVFKDAVVPRAGTWIETTRQYCNLEI